MRIVSVVGARPQFIKLSPVDKALAGRGIDHLVLHTGQHYDYEMSQVFFEGLALPEPFWNLDAGSGEAASMTATMLAGVADVLSQSRPDGVLVYGDTNSTLAAALAAAQLRLPLGHVEAGLRSFNRQMPEELNRVVADHVSDLLFAPTGVAMDNLRQEGLGGGAVLTGDVMADLVLEVKNSLTIGATDPYVVCTLHRASNTDFPDRLGHLVDRLRSIPVPVHLIAHPRLRHRAQEFGVKLDVDGITLREPLPYLEMMSVVARSVGVVTDSGGLQKEACLLGVPCTTLRTETEWVETLEGGRNVLDPDADDVDRLAVRARIAGDWSPYGDGNAAFRIAEAVALMGQ